jgi:hypothetical protein
MRRNVEKVRAGASKGNEALAAGLKFGGKRF